MKTWQVVTAVVVVFALWLGNAMQSDPGYVVIAYQDVSLQTSIWFALLTVLVAGLLLYWLALFLRWTLRSPAAFGRWRVQRRESNATDLTHLGLTRFEEGDHRGALTLLVRGAKFSRSAAVNYLSAARAADGLGDAEQRETYLRQAEEAGCPPQAVRVASARMAARRGEHAATVAALAAAKFNPEVVHLLMEAHRSLGQWDGLEALLPEVRRHAADSLAEVQNAILFGRLGSRATPDALRSAWRAGPKVTHGDPDAVLVYAGALSTSGASDEAEKVLRKSLKSEQLPALLEAYASLEQAAAKGRLKSVQGWLRNAPDSPALLRAAGRIAISDGDNEAGADYLERSLRLEPNAAAEQALGELRAFNGDFARSSAHFRRALTMT